MADTCMDLWEAVTCLTYQMEWGYQVGYPCIFQDISIWATETSPDEEYLHSRLRYPS